MDRIITILLLTILLIVPLHSIQANSSQANNHIIELNVTGLPPLNTPDQMGFMDEVVKEALHRIGYQLKTVRLPAERGLVNANRGVIDGEMSRVKGIEKTYRNLIRVPEKVMDWEFVGFSNRVMRFDHGWQDLENKNVSHINGWKIFEKNVPATAEVTKTNNAEGLFNLLRRNRADVVLYERWGGHFLLHKMKMTDVLFCKPPLAVKEMFIYLNKKHRKIIPALSAAITAMKEEGRYQLLFNKYLMPYQDHSNSTHKSHAKVR